MDHYNNNKSYEHAHVQLGEWFQLSNLQIATSKSVDINLHTRQWSVIFYENLINENVTQFTFQYMHSSLVQHWQYNSIDITCYALVNKNSLTICMYIWGSIINKQRSLFSSMIH